MQTIWLGIIAGMKPAIFLDRDGVIIENRPSYIRSWADVEIFPQALEALAQINRSRYKIVIVTNQSAVGRGIISLEQAQSVNNRLLEVVRDAGGRIDGIFMCPHAPQDECHCRKPKPGLLLQAAHQMHLDLSQSIMIGDALSDLLAGQAAGIQKTILVQTGRGATQKELPRPAKLKPFLIYQDLKTALTVLLQST